MTDSIPDARPPEIRRLHRRRRRQHAIRALIAILLAYAVVAYLLLPSLWRRDERRHPALADAQTITRTGVGIPGDPINVGLAGSEKDLHLAMRAARWYPADPITLESSIRIVGDVFLRRAYDDAPVSNLYLFGRKEDFAFEQPVGADPKRRHHVRFWRSDKPDDSGRPMWLGSVTLDVSVGLSDDTGQVTHHISPDIDLERDNLIADLSRAGVLASIDWVDHFHKQLTGRNGEGDLWQTDGRLEVGIISLNPAATTTPATALRSDEQAPTK
jgi:hypothetical protein